MFCLVEEEPPTVISDFCSAYLQVNQNPAEAAEVKKMSRPIRSRLTANDVLYLCKCRGWDNPICEKGRATGEP